MIKEIFSGVWIVRALIQLVATGLAVWGISFAVSDYVVKANTSSSNITLEALTGSVNRLNETLVSVNETMMDFHGSLTQLASDSAVHGVKLTNVEAEISELEEKLRSNGIRVSYPEIDKEMSFLMAQGIVDAFAANSEIRALKDSYVWGDQEHSPILLQFSPVD